MSRALTILQLLPAMESGGVERGTLELAQGLVARGHRSLVMSAGGQLVSRLQAAGSEHFIAPVGKKSPQVLWQVFALRRFLRQQKVDVLHVRSRLPAWVAWQALKGLSVAQRPAFVTTVHGFYSVKRYSAIMTQGQRVIAVSDSTREYLADNYAALDMSRVRVIERGIDQTQYPFQYRPAAIWQHNYLQLLPAMES